MVLGLASSLFSKHMQTLALGKTLILNHASTCYIIPFKDIFLVHKDYLFIFLVMECFTEYYISCILRGCGWATNDQVVDVLL